MQFSCARLCSGTYYHVMTSKLLQITFRVYLTDLPFTVYPCQWKTGGKRAVEEDQGALSMVFLQSLVQGLWYHCEKHLLMVSL